jgi:hypothetical protein
MLRCFDIAESGISSSKRRECFLPSSSKAAVDSAADAVI